MIEDRDIPLELVRRYVDAMAATFGAHLGKRGAVLDGALTVLGTISERLRDDDRSRADDASAARHGGARRAWLVAVVSDRVIAHECMHIVESDETGRRARVVVPYERRRGDLTER